MGQRAVRGFNNYGTVFAVNTDGTSFTSFSFPSIGLAAKDGTDPEGSLILSDNTLYGTTAAGGAAYGSAYGTVFSLSLPVVPSMETTMAGGQ